MRRLVSVVGLAASLGCLAGCSGDDASFKLGAMASVHLDPTSIVFGDVPRGEEARRSLTVRHTGTGGSIVLHPIQLVTDSPDLSIGVIEKTELEPGEETRIQVVYNSEHDEPDIGQLVIGLNLAATAQIVVPVITPGQRAQFIAKPATVDFGIVQAGAPQTVQVELINIGTAPAVLTEAIVAGDTDLDFKVSVPEGTEVAPDESAFITITYDAEGQNSDEGLVTVRTDRPDVNAIIPVEGEEESPVLVIEPATVQFGWVEPGGSRLVTIRLSNQGNTDLKITDIDLVDAVLPEVGLVSPPSLPLTLAPGELVKMGAIFSPNEQLPMSGQPMAVMVVKSSDAAHDPFEVPLHGAAGVPGIFVYPEDVVDFQYVAEGFSAKRIVTVINVGDDDVVIEAAELYDETTNEFDFANPEVLPANLDPGETVQLILEFDNLQGDEGTEYARFLLHTTDSLVPEYPLDVVARRSERPTCEPAFVPEILSMGAHKAETSAVDTMYVANYGSGNCIYREWDLIGCQKLQMDVRHRFVCDPAYPWSPFSVVSAPIDGEVMGPGDVLSFDVQFDAPEIYNLTLGRDQYFARMTLFVHDPNEKVFKYVAPPGGWMKGVNIRAESALPIIAVEPEALDFGLVRTDCESDAGIVTISNLGPMAAQVQSLTLEGCSSDVKIKNLPSLPYDIDGFDALYLELAFLPTTGGDQACSLHIVTDAMNVPEADVILTASAIDVEHNTDTFTQIPTPKVDVLFVVDDSGSMADEQIMLKQQLPALAGIAAEWGQDYHMAVTTTDTVQLQGKFKGTPPYVTQADPPALFAQHLLVGVTGHWEEMGLEGGWMALSGSNVASTDIGCINKPNACPSGLWCMAGYCRGSNWGFMRKDADLVVIIISDEEDSSPQSVNWYVSHYSALKSAQTGYGVKLHGIVYPPAGCSGSNWGSAGIRYEQAIAAFDGHMASICTSDFTEEFAAIGSKTFGLKDQFYPSLPPDPATIEVRVNGVLCIGGWTWNSNTNAVVFDADGPCYPDYGAQIAIEYDVICQLAND